MITEQGRVLELLLAGAFICQVQDEDAYRYLTSAENRATINSQLNVLNRQLASAADGGVYFASYLSIGDEQRDDLTAQFQQTSNQLLPLIEWLVLVQEAMATDSPLTQGVNIRLNELQTTVEDTPAYSEQIAKIARYSMFGSQSKELDAQLKLIFKRLVEQGYLLKPNADKQIYTATGKIDYLFDVLKFIDETENLALSQKAEDAMSQSNLL